MDLVLSVAGIFLGLPIMAAAAVAIYLESGRPVLFVQERAGRGGMPFRMYKFRTMLADAEQGGQARWAAPGDPRLTRVGRIIRRLRLDEMPQLFNVWKGEMSIIGPRPEREVYIQEFLNPQPIEIKGRRREDAGRKVLLTRSQEALPYYSKRLLVQPGITGWAQVNYQYAGSFDETEVKLMYDLYYLKNLSFPLDCLILLRTIRVVLFGKGAR
jgi:lipopolysaccharide/colanic/teichoic acid biosynthesis glycosyltransferase